MRRYLFIVATIATLAAGGTALARGGGGGHGPHGPHGPPPRPAHRPPPPAPQGWAKVGKRVYTSASWHGGNRGAWSTDVPF